LYDKLNTGPDLTLVALVDKIITATV